MKLEILDVDELIQIVHGGICYDDPSQVVDICGANCDGRDQVADRLRGCENISVKQERCHADIGGCAINGKLSKGQTYATVPRFIDGIGYKPTEIVVAINKRSNAL